MKHVTLCFPLTSSHILLGFKKRGFGFGKLNGFGGKVEAGETMVGAACREVMEEAGLKVAEEQLKQAAVIKFYMGGAEVFECSVFFFHEWIGEPVETEEMRPEWHALDALPFASMWVDDAHWLPMALTGKTFTGEIFLNAEGTVVEKFDWVEGL